MLNENQHLNEPKDFREIKINETYEIRFWTQALNVSRAVLLEAISQVGASVPAVREYIGRFQLVC
jgi:hypothetical protein